MDIGIYLKHKDKNSIEDVELHLQDSSSSYYLGYIVSFNTCLNQVKCLIADNISEQANANYSTDFDFELLTFDL